MALTTLLACLFLLPLPGQPAAKDAQQGQDFANVHRIFVDSMGHSDEAQRFGILLREDLAKEGFAVVSDPATADAILSGLFSTLVDDGHTKALATVSLKAPGGRFLWGGDFKQGFWETNWSHDEIKVRARDVARKLRRDQKSTH